MNRRETDFLERLPMPVRSDDLRTATEVLRATHELLAHPDVERLLATTWLAATSAETVKE
jgi:hypothetical protein